MKKYLALIICGLVLATSSVASARNWTHKQSKIKLWFPDSWNVAKDGGVVSITDPGEEVGLALFTLRASDLERAMDELDAELSKYVTNVKATGDAQETKINGMPAVVIDGTGKVEGTHVSLSVAVVQSPNKKFLVILGIAETKKLKKHERTLTKILTSLKPAR